MHKEYHALRENQTERAEQPHTTGNPLTPRTDPATTSTPNIPLFHIIYHTSRETIPHGFTFLSAAPVARFLITNTADWFPALPPAPTSMVRKSDMSAYALPLRMLSRNSCRTNPERDCSRSSTKSTHVRFLCANVG